MDDHATSLISTYGEKNKVATNHAETAACNNFAVQMKE